MNRASRKVAIVTGGAGGIGRAAALAFAEQGVRVVIADIDDERGEQTARELVDGGASAAYVRADVAKASDVHELVESAVRLYGRLDYAMNNAGILGATGSATADCDEENWDRVIAVNLTGVFLCMKFEIPRMLEFGGGAIVNTASSLSFKADVGYPAYVASKHGVVGLTRAAALEYSDQRIRINAVCPGITKTGMIDEFIADDPTIERALVAREPIGRLGLPEEVAAAAVWLCSEEASFIAGHALLVDGGQVIQA